MTFVKSNRQILLAVPALFAGLLIVVGFFPFIGHAATSIVINELQSAGQTSKDEFVELYNPTDAAVDVTGWRLTKKTAAGNETNIVSTFPSMSILGHGFLLIAHPTEYKGSVAPDITYSTSNTIADDNTAVLYSDAGDTSIDLIGMGKAGSREGTSASNPDPGQSIARHDGVDTNDNSRDFFVGTPSPTNHSGTIGSTPPPSMSSSPNTTGAPSGEQTTSVVTVPKVSSPEVVVNELYPNPPGSDDEEFIELKNNDTDTVDVGLWEIGTSRGRHYVIPHGTTIAPQGFLMLDRRTTGMALENIGDVVSLYRPEEDRPFFTVRYRDDAPDGQAYARSDSGKRWQWTTTRTPNAVNVLADPPLPPVLTFTWSPDDLDAGKEISFDATDSFDPDREALMLSWNFGDGESGTGALVVHTYTGGGKYTVRLVGATPTASTTLERVVTIHPNKVVAPAIGKTSAQGIVEEGEISNVIARTVAQTARVNSSTKTDAARGPSTVLGTNTKATLAKGERVIRGPVLVIPGRFGKTRMLLRVGERVITAQYVAAPWPEMHEGAMVTLNGRTSPTDPDRFLVSSIAEVVDDGENDLPDPQVIKTTEMDRVPLGTLVLVHGEITERHGSTLFIDDGVGEAHIQVKATTGISAAAIQEGSRLTITGVVLASTEGKVIVPRGLEDVVADVVNDATTNAPAWLQPRQHRVWWYVGIVLGSACLAIGAWFMQKKATISPVLEHGAVADDHMDPLDDDG